MVVFVSLIGRIRGNVVCFTTYIIFSPFLGGACKPSFINASLLYQHHFYLSPDFYEKNLTSFKFYKQPDFHCVIA